MPGKLNRVVFSLLSGPALFFIILYIQPDDIRFHTIALIVWMVIWWILEPVPIPATALLPIFFLPFLGVINIKETTASYANPIIFLFMGGFIIALAVEKHNLHKRVALLLIRLTGTSLKGVILGFMLATALLSMWISNTATAVMMLPVAVSIGEIFANEKYQGLSDEQRKKFSLSLFLAIAYSANIGGMATIIGTPPNLVLVNMLQEFHSIELDFLKWMFIALPVSLLLLTITFFYLTRVFPAKKQEMTWVKELTKKELQKLGSLSRSEKNIIVIFLLVLSGWVFKRSLNQFFDLNLNDTMIAMAGGLLMFFTPYTLKNTQFLLNWEDTKRLPWGVIILFGGGLCIAKAMQASGIAKNITDLVLAYSGENPLILLLLFTSITLFLTEFMSNVALTTIFLPIILGVTQVLNLPILYLAMPITLAASCAFMMPISTPPNAVVFSSGHIKMIDMVKKGFILNIISILVISLVCYFASGVIL